MTTTYPSFSFDIKAWAKDQIFVDGNNAWKVRTLWEAANDLPVYEMPLIGMCTNIEPWSAVGSDFMEFCKHAQLINKAQLKYPIILTPGGDIADGRHRLAKALIQSKAYIKIKRLVTMPEPDYVFDDEGNTIAGNE